MFLSSAPFAKPNQANGFAAQFVQRVGDGADGIDGAVPSIVRTNPLEIEERGRCGRKFPPQSAPEKATPLAGGHGN